MGSIEAGFRHRFAIPSFFFFLISLDIPTLPPPLSLAHLLTVILLNREHLPAIGFLGKDGPGFPPKPSPVAASPTPLLSPSNMYPGQPLPYSYPSSNTSAPGCISPLDSRRALEEEKEKSQPQPQPQRQSLPSIHEALGNDNPLPYPAPTSAPSQQPPHTPHTPHPHSLSSNLVARPTVDGPSGPPNPYSNGPSTPFVREAPFPAKSQLQTEASRSSLVSMNTQDSRNPSLHSLNSGKSPTQSTTTGNTSIGGSQAGSGYEYSAPPSAGSVASPNGYTAFSQPYPFQSQPPPNAPAYPGAYETRPYGGPWKPGMPESARVEEVKGAFPGRAPIAGHPHGEAVKRHLDVYDMEASLNEVRFSKERAG